MKEYLAVKNNMRTKQEVISFLESKVGTKVKCIGNSSLDGQCVTLIKSLLEFLGVPDPYKARGHALDCISAYLSEGIAKQGTGFLSVFSNKTMGVVSGVAYGHIWCNAGDGDGAYYESNGQKTLTVTKGKTYSYDKVCNFDSYIKDIGSSEPESTPMADELMQITKADFAKLMKNSESLDKIALLLGLDKNLDADKYIEAINARTKTVTEIKEVIKEVEVPVEKIVYKDNPNLADWEKNGLVTEQIIDGIKYLTNYKKKG